MQEQETSIPKGDFTPGDFKIKLLDKFKKNYFKLDLFLV